MHLDEKRLGNFDDHLYNSYIRFVGSSHDFFYDDSQDFKMILSSLHVIFMGGLSVIFISNDCFVAILRTYFFQGNLSSPLVMQKVWFISYYLGYYAFIYLVIIILNRLGSMKGLSFGSDYFCSACNYFILGVPVRRPIIVQVKNKVHSNLYTGVTYIVTPIIISCGLRFFL